MYSNYPAYPLEPIPSHARQLEHKVAPVGAPQIACCSAYELCHWCTTVALQRPPVQSPAPNSHHWFGLLLIYIVAPSNYSRWALVRVWLVVRASPVYPSLCIHAHSLAFICVALRCFAVLAQRSVQRSDPA